MIGEPSLVLMLMMIGVYGLLFEFMNPGFVAPGVIGGVCLLLALWGLQMLPINYAGLGLILLGTAFFVAEAFVPSHGALGIGGVVAFGFGALLLIDSDSPGFGIPLSLIGAVTLVSAAFVIGVAGMAAKARRRPVVSGAPRMIGALRIHRCKTILDRITAFAAGHRFRAHVLALMGSMAVLGGSAPNSTSTGIP